MKSFKQIIQDKPIYPFDPTPHVSQHLEKNCCDAVRQFLQQHSDLIADDPQNSYLEVRAQRRLMDCLMASIGSVQSNEVEKK